jgi:flagellar biosynthesis protein FlhF
MTVKRFTAATARECLRKVKETLGDDAVIVSNKPIDNGVEILAMSPDSLDALSQSAGSTAARNVSPASQVAPSIAVSPALTYGRNEPVAQPVSQAPRRAAQQSPARQSQTPLSEPESDEDYRVLLSGARRQMAQRASQPAMPPSSNAAPQHSGYRQEPEPAVRPWSPPGMPQKAAAPSMPEPGEHARLRAIPPRHQEHDDILPAAQVAAHLRSAAQASAQSFAQSTRLPEPRIDGPDFADAANPPQIDALMDEMRTIKSLLERQLAGFAWGELAKESPVKALLLAEMLEVGFTSTLSRRLVQDLPDHMAEEDSRRWLRAAVNRRLRTLPADGDIIDRGGVYALVGPTGVGKTTTTAKLAARCVVRYGADRLALLTTDGYRIGAHEQLRIYGRILGVPVYTVRDGDDLRRTLNDLRDKHMVLIDTVGMSQRDRMVAEQAALLSRSGQVNRLLLLNAGARGDLLDDVVRAYAGENLAGCILTKVDEAPSLAPAMDCIVRNGLTLAYVANGQRVPEDLHLPNRTYLLHRAFKLNTDPNAHTLRSEELPLAMSNGQHSAAAPGVLSAAPVASTVGQSAVLAGGYPLA